MNATSILLCWNPTDFKYPVTSSHQARGASGSPYTLRTTSSKSPDLTPARFLPFGGSRNNLPFTSVSLSCPCRNAALMSPFRTVLFHPKFNVSCKNIVMPNLCTVGESSLTCPPCANGSLDACAHNRAFANTGSWHCGVLIDAFLSR